MHMHELFFLKCIYPLFSGFTFLQKIAPESSVCIISVIKGDYIEQIHVHFIYAVISPEVSWTYLCNQTW